MFPTECKNQESNSPLAATAVVPTASGSRDPRHARNHEPRTIADIVFSETALRCLVENGQLVLVALVGGQIAYASPGLWELVNRSCPELQGCSEFVDLLDESDRPRIAELIRAAEDGETGFVADCALSHRGRETVVVRLAAHRIDCEDLAALALIVTDISVQTRQRSRLEFLDSHDPVTGLKNRVALLESAKQAIIGAQVREESLAVLLVDLDQFGKLNDTFGPTVGDAALRVVGERLERSVRATGDLLGRYGGDEFLLVLRNVDHRDTAALIAGHIIESLKLPMSAGGRQCQIGASIGIALFPRDGSDLAALLSHANAALHIAKGTGRGRFAFAQASDDIILAIEPMKWREDFDVGATQIDLQHHQLNDDINALGRDLLAGVETAALREQLDKIVQVLRTQFATEERHLDRHPRPQNAEHKAQHRRLLADVPYLLNGGERSNIALATRHIYDWLGRHIEAFDRRLFEPRNDSRQTAVA